MVQVVPGEEPGGPAGAPRVVRELVERLRATLGVADAIPVSAYEELDDDALRPLLEETLGALGRAVDDVGALLEHYDRVTEERQSLPSPPVPTRHDGALCNELERTLDQDDGVERVQNLAFIARMGMRGRRASLGAMAATDKWELIAAAGSALREVKKALGALDVAVCALEGLPEPSSFYVSELTRSLAVRRAYRIFYADILGAGEPRLADLLPRLRRTATAIAKLTGRPVYASMRVHDRFLLRGVQRRVLAWLGVQRDGARGTETDGLRLFEDVAHVAELMLGVNDRAELRLHDGALASRVLRGLEDEGRDVAWACAELRAMGGRDPALDALVERSDPPAPDALRERLLAMSVRLASDASTAGRTAPAGSPPDTAVQPAGSPDSWRPE